MTYWRYPFLVVPFLLIAKEVRAENSDVKERAARTACLSGDSVKGAAILAELFVASENPVFIYNQGRCFEQNHRYDDAIARFQEFLRVGKKLKKDEKIDAQKHISDCQELLAKQNGSQSGAESGGASQVSTAAGRGGTKEFRERAAKKACLAGDTPAGVAILIDLYLDTNDTTYLFNQGRCLEQNRRYDDAIGRFREYLVKAKNLTPEEKADTDKHINDCESYLHGSKPTESPKSTESSKSVVATPHVGQSPPFQAVVSYPATGAAGSGLRAAGLLAAGVGGAGLIAGLVLNLKVNSMSSDLEGNYGLAADATRKNYKTAGWIAYGAGAACLAGGAVLYYLGWRRERGSYAVALLPTAGPDIGGIVFAGAF